jgi:uncharacterized HAD superfamily protein
MPRRIIGVDIDNTICESISWYYEVGEKLGITVRTDHHEFGITTREDSHRIYSYLCEHDYLSKYQPVEGAVEALQELARVGYEIYYITYRGQSLPKSSPYLGISSLETLKWLKKWDCPSCYNIIFTEISKLVDCREIGAKFLVEDHYSTAVGTDGWDGITVYLLDKPWNQDYPDKKFPNRVSNWTEILNRLKNLNSKNT